MPYFSIVIPVFNKAQFIGKTLTSVLAQSCSDYEIIVVNDGSIDDSEAIVKAFKDERIRYFAKENQGVAVARNFGIDQANADFICFLDADDYWYPDFLATMQRYTQQLPAQKAFACAIEIETPHKVFAAAYSIDKRADFEIVDFFDASQKECVLWTSSSVFHKSVFEHIGTFDPKIKKGEDTELWIRIGLQYSIVFVGKILARYVYDKIGISRNRNYYFEPYVFGKYAAIEKENPKLKQFLDLNRFSAVIKCRLTGEHKLAQTLYNQIDPDTIGWRKALLLQLPVVILKTLIGVKNLAATIGLGKSVFR